MVFELSLASIFALVSSSVGGTLAALLWASPKSNARWLAAFVAVISFALLSGVIHSLGQLHKVLNGLVFINFLAVPCLFRYVAPAVGISVLRFWLHLLPSALVAIVPVMFTGFPHTYIYYLLTSQVMIYLPVLIYLVRRYRHNLKQSFSSLSGIDLLWLEQVCWGLLVLVTFDLMVFPLMALGDNNLFDAQAVFNFLGTVYIFWLTRSAQQQYFVATEPIVTAAYDKSGLDADSADAIARDIIETIDCQRLYLKPALTLRELAQAAGVTPHVASEVLNTAIGQSFYDFINSRRINEAKKLLRETDITVLEIAFAVGFNNKVSFNNAFKRYAKTTPSHFRRLHIVD
ncbi:helix-turn-helix domain-containing protein [Kordiimonas aquimaris]|uniref:helix-turn-helix domain-containing protein n=1 Tax=Kordiimonas aquimaris TaxID=707591 RepID=UPI0021CE08A5|nr:helix-turn-helix transcriptional regulator [Kordiimonas aquimaris]